MLNYVNDLVCSVECKSLCFTLAQNGCLRVRLCQHAYMWLYSAVRAYGVSHCILILNVTQYETLYTFLLRMGHNGHFRLKRAYMELRIIGIMPENGLYGVLGLYGLCVVDFTLAHGGKHYDRAQSAWNGHTRLCFWRYCIGNARLPVSYARITKVSCYIYGTHARVHARACMRVHAWNCAPVDGPILGLCNYLV